MRELKAIAEELIRRQRMDVRYGEGELTIAIDGEDIAVSADEFDRIVFCAEVSKNLGRDLRKAAVASLAFNDEFSLDRAVALGVSPEADCAILARGVEMENVNGAWLLNECKSFRAELANARSFFRDFVANARGPAAEESLSLQGSGDGYFRA